MAEETPFDDFRYYHYNPSLAAAIVFIVLFGGTSGWHVWKMIRTRTWYFIPFVIGCFFEFIGYIGRAMSAKETPDWTLGPYIMQTLLLLLAPALFAASIYMILARIILLTDGNAHSIVKLRWVTKLFVTGDVLSFLAQSAGGGLLSQAKTADDKKRGEMIIVGGLLIQIIVFGFFVVVAGVFNIRIRKVPTQKALDAIVPWQRHLYVLYAASALIMVRSIFRVIEYVMGDKGVLLQKEYYLYIFDAALMWLVTLLFCFWHPSNIITKKTLGHHRDPESQDSGYPLEDSSSPQGNLKR